jgi:hypothetical protein
MQNQFRLDDLLAREVVPQWFEGVAVVQLVCRQLRAKGPESSGFPRPGEILIAPGGSVTISGGSHERPVETAAHVLGLMLGNDVPVRLRLSISQATATDGGYANLAEFSEALAYFERPNPEAIVETFRQRAMAAAPREITPAVRIDARPAIEKRPEPAAPPAPPRVSRLAVIAATFLALVGASIWLIGHRYTDLRIPNVVFAEAAESATPEVHSNVKDKAVAATAGHRENISIAASTTQVSEPRKPAPRSVVEPVPELQVVATTLSYAYPESLPPYTLSNLTATIQLGTITSDDVVTRDPAERLSDRIYSQADPQVTLPVSVYPKLPSDAAGTPTVGRTLLELTIAADGLVERVRMLTAPRNIHEFMLLSAAKAWRFEPARIGDHPVRFRQVLTLTSLPYYRERPGNR